MTVPLMITSGLGVPQIARSSFAAVTRFGSLVGLARVRIPERLRQLRLIFRILGVSAGVVGACFLIYAAYKEAQLARDLARVEGNGPEVEAANRRARLDRQTDRKTRRLYKQWMKVQGYEEPTDHPYVFRLFSEMGDHVRNREYYTIAHRRLRRWFDELPTITALIKPVVERRIGLPPADEERHLIDLPFVDAGENPQGEAVIEMHLTRGQIYDERYREAASVLYAEYEADPRQFARNYLMPGALIRPTGPVVYRASCVIIEAALTLHAEDINTSQYFLGQEHMMAAALERVDALRLRGGLGMWAAGLVSLRQAIWPSVRLPPPR